jgi:putative ABC transport system permease protein
VISAARLAWLQLRQRKVRMGVALAGVTFAVVLIAMQLGFQDALYRSAVNLHEHLLADVVLVHPYHNFVALPSTISRRRVYQALGYPGVASVASVYTTLAKFSNTETGRGRDIFVMGVDPAADVFDIPEVRAQRTVFRYPDVVLFDEQSRPEFGHVADRVRAGGPVATEIGGHHVTVGGLFPLGTSFGVDGSVIASEETFLRLFPYRSPGTIWLGLVRLLPGVDAIHVRDGLAATLPRDVRVLTKRQFMDQEIDYWATATPIGYVFAFGVIMGLAVGSIVVYQILFADISDHLDEYATLKAMGYANRYLATVVAAEALILGIAGFVPGLGLSWWLFGLARSATKLPMAVEPLRAFQLLSLTVGMCALAGLLAVRRLRSADPADVF